MAERAGNREPCVAKDRHAIRNTKNTRQVCGQQVVVCATWNHGHELERPARIALKKAHTLMEKVAKLLRRNATRRFIREANEVLEVQRGHGLGDGKRYTLLAQESRRLVEWKRADAQRRRGRKVSHRRIGTMNRDEEHRDARALFKNALDHVS